jgi:hypothetical protein
MQLVRAHSFTVAKVIYVFVLPSLNVYQGLEIQYR